VKKVFKRFKFLILLCNLALIICGCFFIFSFFKKTPVECVLNEQKEEQKNIENGLVEELSSCQNDLFVLKNELEQTKNIPDTRKDIVELAITLRDFEKNIGKKRNFSNECVKIFSLSSRIQVVQEYVLKYKSQFFQTNCIVDNKDDIIKMIIPFQVKFLEIKKEQEQTNDKWWNRAFNEVKFFISKLFVKSQIQKSDIEIAIDKNDYNEAFSILISGGFEKNDEFNKLYNSVSVLKNMQEMVDGIYNILKVNS